MVGFDAGAEVDGGTADGVGAGCPAEPPISGGTGVGVPACWTGDVSRSTRVRMLGARAVPLFVPCACSTACSVEKTAMFPDLGITTTLYSMSVLVA